MSGTSRSESTGDSRERRRLVAVLYADMVGYSRLIGLDDTGTLKRLRALRDNLIDPTIEEHGGWVAQTAGDSLLVVFDNIEGAVLCAVEVQRQIPFHDVVEQPDQSIRFRIGVNVGDVIPEGTDLHGDAVNVAVRLQAECPPGGVCVSRTVRDHVHARLNLAFIELGPLALKNIPQPVEAFLLEVDPRNASRDPQEPTAWDFDRRGQAILVADVVGYTRHMEAAELETHARFRLVRVSLVDPSVVSHRGEVAGNTGDGFIAVFETAQDAIRCAIDLQLKLATLEAPRTQDQRIIYRIGLHLDTAALGANDVYAAGVNIAVRLQSMAPPGGIVISSTLLDQAIDATDMRFACLGEIKLRNLARPILAYVLLLPGIESGTVAGFGKPVHAVQPPSIAILPFDNLSTEPSDSYFAAGIVEDIVVSLSNIGDLLVVSRGSTLTFKEPIDDPIQVSEKLGVRYLLRGSVRRDNRRIWISVNLVDVATISVIWADKYASPLVDLFAIQDEIAFKVVANIATHVRRIEISRALPSSTSPASRKPGGCSREPRRKIQATPHRTPTRHTGTCSTSRRGGRPPRTPRLTK
jgi:class 3 adenylate cyclase/TolB-like protein